MEEVSEEVSDCFVTSRRRRSSEGETHNGDIKDYFLKSIKSNTAEQKCRKGELLQEGLAFWRLNLKVFVLSLLLPLLLVYARKIVHSMTSN